MKKTLIDSSVMSQSLINDPESDGLIALKQLTIHTVCKNSARCVTS